MKTTARTFKYIIRKTELNAEEAGRLKIFLYIRNIKNQTKKQPPLFRDFRDLVLMIQRRTDYTFEEKTQTALYESIYNMLLRSTDFINSYRERIKSNLNQLNVYILELSAPQKNLNILTEKMFLLREIEQETGKLITKELAKINIKQEQTKALQESLQNYFNNKYLTTLKNEKDGIINGLAGVKLTLKQFFIQGEASSIKEEFFYINLFFALLRETALYYSFDFSSIEQRCLKLLNDNALIDKQLRTTTQRINELLESIKNTPKKEEKTKQKIQALFSDIYGKGIKDLLQDTLPEIKHYDRIREKLIKSNVEKINFFNNFDSELLHIAIQDIDLQEGDI